MKIITTCSIVTMALVGIAALRNYRLRVNDETVASIQQSESSGKPIPISSSNSATSREHLPGPLLPPFMDGVYATSSYGTSSSLMYRAGPYGYTFHYPKNYNVRALTYEMWLGDVVELISPKIYPSLKDGHLDSYTIVAGRVTDERLLQPGGVSPVTYLEDGGVDFMPNEDKFIRSGIQFVSKRGHYCLITLPNSTTTYLIMQTSLQEKKVEEHYAAVRQVCDTFQIQNGHLH